MLQVLWIAAAVAGDVSALDAKTGLNGLEWGSGPTADMVLQDDGSPPRATYLRTTDAETVAGVPVREWRYYFCDRKALCIVSWEVGHQNEDILSMLTKLREAYGTPEVRVPFGDETKFGPDSDDNYASRNEVWRGQRVELKCSVDLWDPTSSQKYSSKLRCAYSFLPLTEATKPDPGL
jgi:hypothetical protein